MLVVGCRTMLRRFAGVAAVSLLSLVGACYSAGGDGTAPPTRNFYFPVGLVVSRGGNVLYAVNSDFDLQWNGGTLQSYDLYAIRRDVMLSLSGRPEDLAGIPYVAGRPPAQPCSPEGTFPGQPPIAGDDGVRYGPGDVCAPPVRSEPYVRDSAIIGAFATEMQLSKNGHRLFIPVRGDATLTWADVAIDDPNVAPPPPPADKDYGPFHFDCGTRVDSRCDVGHHAGASPNEPGNTRQLTMPGEPFGMAQSEDGSAIVITHQVDGKASLFTSGLPPVVDADDPCPPVSNPSTARPALQFIVDSLTPGATGLTAVPHEARAFASCADRRPSFVQTSRGTPALDLLRYYDDDGVRGPSDNYRPYLVRESVIPVQANAGGADSRGIAIDPTPRIKCKRSVKPVDPSATPPRTQAMVDAELAECARTPARVFIANRSPSSLILGEVGQSAFGSDAAYNPDRITLFDSIPLTTGPSRLYLAPIVDRDGNYALRVFIVCSDSQIMFIYDPETRTVENTVRVGLGPFGVAFDPFDMEDVALQRAVPMDPRHERPDLRRYSFAYVASFTNSFVQVIDLDNSRTKNASFETVVFTLGQPTTPKGSK
jgi:YVTN family beta-propeller protein